MGEDEERPANVRLADHVVMHLMEPYINKGHNVTTDNFFKSIKLCKDLASKRTSIVETVNKICRELPNLVQDVGSQIYSTSLHAHNGITMTTYKYKKNKNVVLFSTLHPTVTIDNT